MGSETSSFLRVASPLDPERKSMATQVRLRGARAPSVTFSWPAGNSGVYLQMRSDASAFAIDFSHAPEPVYEDGQRGVVTRVRASASISLERAVAGSMLDVRLARDDGKLERRSDFKLALLADGSIAGERRSVDGKSIWRIELKPVDARASIDANGNLTVAGRGPLDPVEFDLKATTNEVPLTPVAIEDVIAPEALAAADASDVEELSYLLYEESFLAGADTYLTRFGRDNQFLLAIGGDALLPKAYEIVFASHLDAMRADGNLSHEPYLGEAAVWRRRELGKKSSREPVERYQMIDTRFLLAFNAPAYVRRAGAQRAAKFFAGRSRAGGTYKNRLKKNFEFILASARPFARMPVPTNLISLEPGEDSGDWRDSPEGLGHGRIPYDVNVAFVPAALAGISDLAAALDAYDRDPELTRMAAEAREMRVIWSTSASAAFDVDVSERAAESASNTYGRELGMSVKERSLVARAPGGEDGVRFSAVALDRRGSPIPIMSSDGGFLMLLGGDAPESTVLRAAQPFAESFPRGLISPVGAFVSNAAYADDALRSTWKFAGYHQVVVWPWQELLAAKGIERQLERSDLRPRARKKLEAAELGVWRALYRTAGRLSFELYGVRANHDGRLEPVPFGQDRDHGTPSAIIQGWSKLSMLVFPPDRVLRALGPFPKGAKRPGAQFAQSLRR